MICRQRLCHYDPAIYRALQTYAVRHDISASVKRAVFPELTILVMFCSSSLFDENKISFLWEKKRNTNMSSRVRSHFISGSLFSDNVIHKFAGKQADILTVSQLGDSFDIAVTIFFFFGGGAVLCFR